MSDSRSNISEFETKYQCKDEMKRGLQTKIKDTIYYKFSSNSVLYKIDNIIKQKYDIHSTDLLGFILNIFILQKKANLFIDNFLKILIKSHLYRNTDKLQIFSLIYTLPSTIDTNNNYKLYDLIQELVVNNKYIMPPKNKSAVDTLFYNLLSNSGDTHCHDFYDFVCTEYSRDTSESNKTLCGSISEYEKQLEKNEDKCDDIAGKEQFDVQTPFKEVFDLWINSVISYEISLINYTKDHNTHTHQFLKSLYYLLIYMLHHSRSRRIKSSLFIYIKKINTIYLSTIIVSIGLIEEQLGKYSLTILDSLQAENCRKLVSTYTKRIHIRNNIFIKLAFRYSLEYYARNLIRRLENITPSGNDLELLICDIKEFIRLVCYYKETSNIKLYKQLNKICVEKILLSKNYKKKYYNLGIYSQDMKYYDANVENITLNQTDEFLNPHFIADYVKFIHFCYPKIKMNKQMYILLVDFFIFTVKEKDVWTISELEGIWNRLIYLIYKYSNTRKNITFPEEEKNIYFIHCILKRLHNMNLDMTSLLDVVNKYKLTSDESMKQYIDSINYNQNKKYLLCMLLRKLRHPKLKDLCYKNVIRDKFINTLNETLFGYTPNMLKKYFNSYYGRIRKYTNYIANTRELYEIFNCIYECIFKRDMEKGYIKRIKSHEEHPENKLHMKEESLFRKILEEPMFFNFENIKYINDLKCVKMGGNLKYSILCSLDDYIKQLNFQKTEISDIQNNIEFTDEFLDPIMKVEIKDPIVLPNCNNIMDRAILEEMLLYNNINPFTQDELYMADILKYNETEHSKELIQNFLKQKQMFVEEYINK
jgi:hypothetical protein